jgi:hypothetical protein
MALAAVINVSQMALAAVNVSQMALAAAVNVSQVTIF